MLVDKSTVSRVQNDVTAALAELSPQFILWPSEQQKREVRSGFDKLGGFPNVVGCIDGIHVRIQALCEDEKSYVNRKNYHSINVMAVCDYKDNLPHHYIPSVFCQQHIIPFIADVLFAKITKLYLPEFIPLNFQHLYCQHLVWFQRLSMQFYQTLNM